MGIIIEKLEEMYVENVHTGTEETSHLDVIPITVFKCCPMGAVMLRFSIKYCYYSPSSVTATII